MERNRAGPFLKGFLTAFQVRYAFFFRLCGYLQGRRLALPAYPVARLIFQHCTYKYGVEIAPCTRIGPGLFIGHFGGILVSNAAKINLVIRLRPGSRAELAD